MLAGTGCCDLGEAGDGGPAISYRVRGLHNLFSFYAACRNARARWTIGIPWTSFSALIKYRPSRIEREKFYSFIVLYCATIFVVAYDLQRKKVARCFGYWEGAQHVSYVQPETIPLLRL